MSSVEAREIAVHIGGPTAYTDYPEIPERFSRDYKLLVLPEHAQASVLHHSVDASVYDGDLVSDTIANLGVWEVPQTILLASAFEACDPEMTEFYDFGSSVGWFSALALSYGLEVTAFDGDPRMITLLDATAAANEWEDLTLIEGMITEVDPLPVVPGDSDLIVKIDIEGHERAAVHLLAKHFVANTVAVCLMEVSPCFEDYYPALLEGLFDMDYHGYVMPTKRHPPPVVDDIPTWLREYSLRLDTVGTTQMRRWVDDQHQFDILLVRDAVEWG